LLCMSVLFFILMNRLQIKRLPSSEIFVFGFYIFTLGRIFTVLEELFLEDILNLLEHAFYAVSSVLLLIWIWNVFGNKNRGSK
ncbi:MAG: hypothetical protein P1P69_06665, partial [Methanosarcinaceae archaeon]|nr:hypothetical protein [Methanosarcinaceae archaeon]